MSRSTIQNCVEVARPDRIITKQVEGVGREKLECKVGGSNVYCNPNQVTKRLWRAEQVIVLLPVDQYKVRF